MSVSSFDFDIRALKATAIAASTEQTRYYLNGVCVEHSPSGPIFIATDGHRLIASNHKWMEVTAPQFAPAIIPLSLIKRIKVSRKFDIATMTIEHKEGGAILISIYYAGATYAENSIDGTFPDWRRVIPQSCDGTISQYNPAYLSDFAEAGRVLAGGKCDVSVAVSYNGGSPALVRFWHEDKTVQSFGVIMPIRTNPVMQAPPVWTQHAKPEVKAEVKAEAPVAEKSAKATEIDAIIAAMTP
jgi:DNA polymerase-3 subunit beta